VREVVQVCALNLRPGRCQNLADHSRKPSRHLLLDRSDEVIAGIDLSGLRAIVTGANSGVCVETARPLASAGAATGSPSTHSSPGQMTIDGTLGLADAAGFKCGPLICFS
jgi:hypothetical protein